MHVFSLFQPALLHQKAEDEEENEPKLNLEEERRGLGRGAARAEASSRKVSSLFRELNLPILLHGQGEKYASLVLI